jgi:hypothetical protein|tara:strand:+ start:4973 stop:5572 length:600 start_codon:yes stop_codon:yes gene_type:complete
MVKQTELDAVNEVLSLVGIGEIADLTAPLRQDALQASATLSQGLMEIATTRNYYNRYEDITLTRDTDNKIPIAANVYDVELRNSNKQVVIKNNFLYNLTDNTFVFDSSLKADITYYLQFVELPEVVKRYLTMKTARKLYLKLFGVSPHLQALAMEEKMAYDVWQRYEDESGDLNILNHFDVHNIWYGARQGGRVPGIGN